MREGIELVQIDGSRRHHGRVFANLYGAIGLAAGLSYVIGGRLLDSISAGTVLTVGGAGGCAVTAVFALRMLTSTRHAETNDDPGL
jgi:hypothetical protein